MSHNENGQIKGAGIIAYITIAFNILTGLLYTPWMIHKIGDSNYAIYTMAMSIVNMFLMDFGIGSASIKFIAEAKAQGNSKKVNEYASNTFIMYMILSAILAIFLLAAGVFLNNIYSNLAYEDLQILKELYIFVAVYSILYFPFTTFSSFLNGIGYLIQLKITVLIQKILNVVLIVIALLLGMGVHSLVMASAVTTLIMVGIQFFFIKKSREISFKFQIINFEVIKQVGKFSFWLLISQICERITNTLAPSVIGAILPVTAVTIFNLSITLERYVYTIATGINGLFLPKITNIVYTKNFSVDLILELLNKIGKIILTLVGGIVLGFLIEGKEFVVNWMGDEYEQIFYGALLFMIPLVITSSQMIAYTYLTVINKIKYQSISDAMSAVIGIVLLILFSLKIGVFGAIAALVFSSIIKSIFMNIIFAKVAGLKMGKFWKNVYFKWILIAIISIMITKLFYIKQMTGWGSVVVNGIIYLFIYALLIWFFYFDKNIKKIIFTFFEKNKK